MNLHWNKVHSVFITICFVMTFSISGHSEEKTYTEENSLFIIVYDNALLEDHLAVGVHMEFKNAYSELQEWGFRTLDYRGGKKLEVYVVKSFEEANVAGKFIVHRRSLLLGGRVRSWIELKIRGGIQLNSYYKTLYHELFHAIQYPYASDWSLSDVWLKDATADAMADELVNLLHPEVLPSYIFEETTKERFKRGGVKQNNYIASLLEHGFTSREGRYTFSPFFTWLIQEFSSYRQKTDIVKKIWEQDPRSSSRSIITEVGEANFKRVFHQSAVAILTGGKHPSPFGFSDQRMLLPRDRLHPMAIPEPNTFSAFDSLFYLKTYDFNSREFTPSGTLKLKPFHGAYLNLVLFSDDNRPLEHPFYFEKIDSSNVDITGVLITDGQEVQVFPMVNHKIEIGHISSDDKIREFFLVMTNPTEIEQGVQLRMVAGTPPYVKEFKMSTEDGTTIYHAKWRKDTSNSNIRILDKHKDIPLTFEGNVSAEKTLTLEIVTSHCVGAPKIFLKKDPRYSNLWINLVEGPRTQEGFHYKGTVRVPLSDYDPLLLFDISNGRSDTCKGEFDTNPASVAHIENGRWVGFEGVISADSFGGSDKNHSIRIVNSQNLQNSPQGIHIFESNLSACTVDRAHDGKFFIILDQPASYTLPSGDRQETTISRITGTDSNSANVTYSGYRIGPVGPYLMLENNPAPFTVGYGLQQSSQGYVLVAGDSPFENSITVGSKVVKPNGQVITAPSAEFTNLLQRSTSNCAEIPSSFPIVHVTHQGRKHLKLHELIQWAWGTNASSNRSSWDAFVTRYKNGETAAKDWVQQKANFEIVFPFMYDGKGRIDGNVTLSGGGVSKDIVFPDEKTFPWLVNFGNVNFKPGTTYTLTISNAYAYFGSARVNSGSHTITFATALDPDFYSLDVGDVAP